MCKNKFIKVAELELKKKKKKKKQEKANKQQMNQTNPTLFKKEQYFFLHLKMLILYAYENFLSTKRTSADI